MATDVVMAVEMKSRRLLFDEEQVVRVRQSFETLNADAPLSINEAVNARNDNITFIVTITDAQLWRKEEEEGEGNKRCRRNRISRQLPSFPA